MSTIGSVTVSELREKCRVMRANGVDVCWLIDPQTGQADVFDAAVEGMTLDADAVLTSEYLPGFELNVAELFAQLDR